MNYQQFNLIKDNSYSIYRNHLQIYLQNNFPDLYKLIHKIFASILNTPFWFKNYN